MTNNDNDYQIEQAKSAEEAARRNNVDAQVIYAGNDSVTQSTQLLSAVQAAPQLRPDAIIFEPVGATDHAHRSACPACHDADVPGTAITVAPTGAETLPDAAPGLPATLAGRARHLPPRPLRERIGQESRLAGALASRDLACDDQHGRGDDEDGRRECDRNSTFILSGLPPARFVGCGLFGPIRWTFNERAPGGPGRVQPTG